MEREPNMGAGPETTGNEQAPTSAVVHEQPTEAFGEAAPEGAHALRRHDLGARPDRLHTSGHPGVRGDRLEIHCVRRRWPWGDHDGI